MPIRKCSTVSKSNGNTEDEEYPVVSMDNRFAEFREGSPLNHKHSIRPASEREHLSYSTSPVNCSPRAVSENGLDGKFDTSQNNDDVKHMFSKLMGEI